MSVEEGEFRAALGHFASGVVLLTGVHAGRPAGLTLQSFFSLSLDPPLVAMAVGRRSASWPRVAGAGGLCANVLAADQEALAMTFADTGADKFAGVGWSPGANGSPRVHGAICWIEATVVDTRAFGDHHLVVAGVEAVETAPGQPLMFYRGGFGGFLA